MMSEIERSSLNLDKNLYPSSPPPFLFNIFKTSIKLSLSNTYFTMDMPHEVQKLVHEYIFTKGTQASAPSTTMQKHKLSMCHYRKCLLRKTHSVFSKISTLLKAYLSLVHKNAIIVEEETYHCFHVRDRKLKNQIRKFNVENLIIDHWRRFFCMSKPYHTRLFELKEE